MQNKGLNANELVENKAKQLWKHFKSTSSIITVERKFLTNHQLHEASQTPEGLHFILSDKQDGREEVAHPLDITWTEGDREVLSGIEKEKNICSSNEKVNHVLN